MKTYQPKAKDISRQWHLIDAKGKVLGRTATSVTRLLMGKHKVNYAPHMDMGDYVVVVNADKISVTGRKAKQKLYRSHSGYPGGFKEVKFEKLINEMPERVIEYAVSGMLPKNRLHSRRMARLKVVAGERNPYDDKFRERSRKNENKK